MPANEANPIYLSEGERRDLEALVRQQTCIQTWRCAPGSCCLPAKASASLAAALAREHRQPCRRTLG